MVDNNCISFLGLTVTKYHKLGDWRQAIYFLTVPVVRGLNSGSQHDHDPSVSNREGSSASQSWWFASRAWYSWACRRSTILASAITWHSHCTPVFTLASSNEDTSHPGWEPTQLDWLHLQRPFLQIDKTTLTGTGAQGFNILFFWNIIQ